MVRPPCQPVSYEGRSFALSCLHCNGNHQAPKLKVLKSRSFPACDKETEWQIERKRWRSIKWTESVNRKSRNEQKKRAWKVFLILQSGWSKSYLSYDKCFWSTAIAAHARICQTIRQINLMKILSRFTWAMNGTRTNNHAAVSPGGLSKCWSRGGKKKNTQWKFWQVYCSKILYTI